MNNITSESNIEYNYLKYYDTILFLRHKYMTSFKTKEYLLNVFYYAIEM